MFDENYSEDFEKHWKSLPSYAEKDKAAYYAGWNARQIYNTERTNLTTVRNRAKILSTYRPIIRSFFKNIEV